MSVYSKNKSLCHPATINESAVTHKLKSSLSLNSQTIMHLTQTASNPEQSCSQVTFTLYLLSILFFHWNPCSNTSQSPDFLTQSNPKHILVRRMSQWSCPNACQVHTSHTFATKSCFEMISFYVQFWMFLPKTIITFQSQEIYTSLVLHSLFIPVTFHGPLFLNQFKVKAIASIKTNSLKNEILLFLSKVSTHVHTQSFFYSTYSFHFFFLVKIQKCKFKHTVFVLLDTQRTWVFLFVNI